MAQAEIRLPVAFRNFTDFFASIFHASNAGRMFRPDNPLMPNYKYVPVAYHSRASSVRVSGTPVKRPQGQRKGQNEDAPSYGPSRNLDFELELGAFIGTGTELGTPIPVGKAADHVFGYLPAQRLVGARHPGLGIPAARTVPRQEFRHHGFAVGGDRGGAGAVSHRRVTNGRKAIPPRCRISTTPDDQANGGLDITLEAYFSTETMRKHGTAPARITQTSFALMYWTIAQMVAHHTSNGCNLEIGDLIGSGTVSGPDKSSWGSLLELTARGREPLELPGSEKRGFIEDGDEIIFRGFCAKPGYPRIGFGECRAVIMPAG